MASVNKVFLLGNLGSEPELKQTPGGQSVCTFSLATNEQWTDKAGEKQQKTEWHRIVVWGKQAEHCANHLGKGKSAHIEGRIQTREWQDKDGQKRFTTEIIASWVTFVGYGENARQNEADAGRGPAGNGGARPAPARQAAQEPQRGGYSAPLIDDSDVPF